MTLKVYFNDDGYPTWHKPAPKPPTVDHFRVFRGAVLNGVEPPATTVAALEARGINVGDLEARIRDSWYWRR